MSEVRGQRSEVRDQRSEDRGQRTEVRGQNKKPYVCVGMQAIGWVRGSDYAESQQFATRFLLRLFSASLQKASIGMTGYFIGGEEKMEKRPQ